MKWNPSKRWQKVVSDNGREHVKMISAGLFKQSISAKIKLPKKYS